MSEARRTTVEIEWAGKDVTTDLAPHLLSLSYADHLTGSADSLNFDLEDREGKWSGDWRPTFGDTCVARIKATPWLTAVEDLRCGKFAHDKIAIKGPPKVATFACVSAPMGTGLRRTKRTRAWNKVSLRDIAQDIATRSGLTLLWDGAAGAKYQHRKQEQKSDLEFLEELAKESGRTLKITEDQIVVFDESSRDQAASVGTIDLAGGHVLSWSFDSDDSDRYGLCIVSYFNARTGKVVKYQYTDPSNSDGQTLEIRTSCDDAGQAERRAKAHLRASNKWANKGRLTVMGDPGLVAGTTFDLVSGYGFNGKYIVTKATHSPVGGYAVELEVRLCLEGY